MVNNVYFRRTTCSRVGFGLLSLIMKGSLVTEIHMIKFYLFAIQKY